MNEAARSRWDDGRREPVTGNGREASDPLAELARLVAQEDPYRNMFRPAPAPAVVDEHEWHEDSAGRSEPPYVPDHGTPGVPAAALPAEDWHGHAETTPPGHADHAGGDLAWTDHDGAYDQDHAYADDERYYAV